MTHTMYWICVHFAIELLRIVCRRPGVRVLPKPVCDMSNSARPNVVLVAKKTGMYINRWGDSSPSCCDLPKFKRKGGDPEQLQMA